MRPTLLMMTILVSSCPKIYLFTQVKRANIIICFCQRVTVIVKISRRVFWFKTEVSEKDNKKIRIKTNKDYIRNGKGKINK